ncbi:unnamed protein product [Lota lota]
MRATRPSYGVPHTKDRLKGKLDDSEARVQLAEEHSRELQDKCCLLEDTAARLRKNATEVAKSMTQLEGLNRELQEKSRAAALHEEAQCKEASQEKERNAQLTTKVQELEAKADPETQERERLCITLREETSFALDKVKQLSQELQVEKQKTGRAESILRELADSLKKLTRERDDLAGEVLGLRRQLEDKDLNELVKKHKSAVSQDAQNLAQISDLQAQLGEALTEKQEVQEKMQALQSQLESKEQSTVEKSQVGRQKAKVRELETKLKFEKAQVKRLEGLVASQKETQGNDRLKGKLDDSEARVQLAEEHSRELQDKCCLLEDTAARLRKNATEVAKSMTQLEGLNRELQEKSRAAALHEEAQCKEASQEKERNAQLTTKVQELEAKADPETQERERLCITLREETSFALDKVKQLSQELQVEKQKTGRAESILRELADSLKKLTRERDDLAGEVLGLRRQLEDKDLNELVKKHKSAVSQDAQNLAQISDLQAQLGEALTEKQEVQEKMQALQSQLESKEQSTVEKSQVGRQKAKVRELETKLKFEKAQVKRLEGLVASQKETQGNEETPEEGDGWP